MSVIGEVTFRDVLIEETRHGILVKPKDEGGSVKLTVERCYLVAPKRLTYLLAVGPTPERKSGVAIQTADPHA